MRNYTISLIVLIMVCSLQAEAHETNAVRKIKVDGIATMEVLPDVVDIRMIRSVLGDRPKSAMSQLRKNRKPLLEDLIRAGVKKSDVSVSHVNVTPRYKAHPNSHVIDGYEASIMVVATLRNFSKFGDVLEAATVYSIKNMHTYFRSTKLAQKKKEVRELALKAARDKANQMAKFMNVKLGKVFSMEETAGNTPLWASSPVSNVIESAPRSSNQKLLAGSLDLSLTVKVTFQIR